MRIEDVKTVNQWLAINKKEGASQLNVEFLGEFKELNYEFGKINMVLYFMTVSLDINYMRTMFLSGIKQRAYIQKVIIDLKNYRVDKRFEKMFRKDIGKLKKRIEHIFRIIKLNMHLTAYEPFFNENGYDWLMDFDTMIFDLNTGESQFNDLNSLIGSRINEWNENHKDIVENHMKAIAPEIEADIKRSKERKENARREKELTRKERKREQDEIKEMKANAHRHREEERKIDASFGRYYTKSYWKRVEEKYGYY